MAILGGEVAFLGPKDCHFSRFVLTTKITAGPPALSYKTLIKNMLSDHPDRQGG